MLKILERIEHAFLNGDGRHEDDEFCQPVALVKFVDGAEINKRLACAGFHLDADVIFRGEFCVGFGNAVFGNNFLFIFLDLRRSQVGDVGLNAEQIGIVERVANLAFQHADDRRDCATLIFQIFELNFH